MTQTSQPTTSNKRRSKYRGTQVFKSDWERKFKRQNPQFRKRTRQEIRDQKKLMMDLLLDLFMEQPNGFVLDGIGYFCIGSISRRGRVWGRATIRQKGLRYQPMVIPLFKNQYLKFATFFPSKHIWKRMMQAYEDGRNYICHMEKVKNIIGNGRRKKRPSSTRKLYSGHNSE